MGRPVPAVSRLHRKVLVAGDATGRDEDIRAEVLLDWPLKAGDPVKDSDAVQVEQGDLAPVAERVISELQVAAPTGACGCPSVTAAEAAVTALTPAATSRATW
jgi:hypothetical protein